MRPQRAFSREAGGPGLPVYVFFVVALDSQLLWGGGHIGGVPRVYSIGKWR